MLFLSKKSSASLSIPLPSTHAFILLFILFHCEALCNTVEHKTLKPDPTVLPAPCALLACCLWKNFNKSLIRGVNKCRNKGEQSEGIHSNSLVIKQSQGLYFLFEGYRF